jgi:two-component system, OmpR family, sensor kinase
MSGPGRLSLRARLLVLLIAVTAAFLLIMGVVSTVVLSKRLGHQLDIDLATESHRPVKQIASSSDYAAVKITFPPLAVQPVTGSTAATQELLTVVRSLLATHGIRAYLGAPSFAVPRFAGGPRLRAVARVIHGKGPGSPGKAILVVARPVGLVTTQVGGIVIAELITGGGLILLLAVSGRWLIGRGLAPLDRMAHTAQEITSRGDLTTRMPDADGQTEVGRLGGAINTMLDRIQQAFGARLRSEQKVREFAADASHELRTPLTTIRGYAELYRQGALGPDQLPDAMRRIEQEADRMSTMVAELLELARLDRTSSLDLAETDLAGLVRDAAADASAVEPGRPVTVRAPGRLIATVDEARIRQILANVLGNVRDHTPAATAVEIRLGMVPGGAVLEVADAGPGMSGEDAARAFDRFHRGTERPDGRAPGRPGRGGSGLGLSIVQAIAAAHGGQAVLESWPGRGTRVRVWLPEAPAATTRPAPTPGPANARTGSRWRAGRTG